jgi:hypothetical protein
MISAMRFSEAGPWELPVEGFEVLHMTLAFGVDIVAYGEEGSTAQIRLAGPFEIQDADGRGQALDPSRDPWERLAALFVLRHDTIQRLTITNRSELFVEFASGRRVTSRGRESRPSGTEQANPRRRRGANWKRE